MAFIVTNFAKFAFYYLCLGKAFQRSEGGVRMS